MNIKIILECLYRYLFQFFAIALKDNSVICVIQRQIKLWKLKIEKKLKEYIYVEVYTYIQETKYTLTFKKLHADIKS